MKEKFKVNLSGRVFSPISSIFFAFFFNFSKKFSRFTYNHFQLLPNVLLSLHSFQVFQNYF